MYDAKNERHEFMAEDSEEAARKAADFFGAAVEDLTIDEFPEGEVYGLAGRCVIVASLRDRKVPAAGRSEGRGGGRSEGRGAGRSEGRGGGRSEGRGAGRSEGRGARREEGGRGEHRGRGGRGGGERREAPERLSEPEFSPIAEEPEEPQEPSVGTAQGEVGEIGEFLLGVMERLDLGPFEISESAEGNLLVFEVKGSAIRKLASGDGRAVDALQLLANQAAKRRDGDSTRVVIDVEGNAEAREDFLTRLASRAAGRARQTGRAVALDAMNGRDRRTIHMALRDEADVATMSVGEGRYRQVVIVPEGAPEYENARRESATANAQREH
jgi:predicted RNA-binding protein Jag